MAESAKSAAEKAVTTTKEATENLTEPAKRGVGQAADVTREMATNADEVARRGLQVVERVAGAAGEAQREVAQRSAEGTAQFGEAFAGLVKEQTRHNLEAMTALSRTVDWGQVVKAVDWQQVMEIQGDYLHASMERMGRLAQRYVEISQTVMGSVSSVVAKEARRAA
jgi:hypothetical protein